MQQHMLERTQYTHPMDVLTPFLVLVAKVTLIVQNQVGHQDSLSSLTLRRAVIEWTSALHCSVRIL